MVVLRPGEDLATERVRLACGAFAIAALHYQYEQWKEAGRPERHPRIEGWDRYVAMLDATDPERLHQRIHAGHNCWVIDEEWEFVTPELIEDDVHGRHGRRTSPERLDRARRRRAQPGDAPAAARRA